jgi:hypothetical protein
MQQQMEITGSEVWAVSGMVCGDFPSPPTRVAQAAEFYDIGIQNLVPILNKCLDKGGDYVEK